MGVWDFSVCGRELVAKETRGVGYTMTASQSFLLSCCPLCDGEGEMSLTDCILGRKGRAVLSCGRGFPSTMKLALSCSQRGNGEEECYWKMFLIIAEIFSKCFFFFLLFFSVTFSGAECK